MIFIMIFCFLVIFRWLFFLLGTSSIRRRRRHQGMRWHHQCNGHELEQTPGDGEGREAWLAALHGVMKNRTWPGNWTTRRTSCAQRILQKAELFLVKIYFSLSGDEYHLSTLEHMAFFHLEYLHVFVARTSIHLWHCCGKSQDCLN